MRLLLPFASPVKVMWKRVPPPLMALVHPVATDTVARHVPPGQLPFTVHELPALLPPEHVRTGTRTQVPPSGQSVSVKQELPPLLPPAHAKLATTRQPKLKVPSPSLTAVPCTTASLS